MQKARAEFRRGPQSPSLYEIEDAISQVTHADVTRRAALTIWRYKRSGRPHKPLAVIGFWRQILPCCHPRLFERPDELAILGVLAANLLRNYRDSKPFSLPRESAWQHIKCLRLVPGVRLRLVAVAVLNLNRPVIHISHGERSGRRAAVTGYRIGAPS